MSWKVKIDVKCSDIFYDDLVQVFFNIFVTRKGVARKTKEVIKCKMVLLNDFRWLKCV